MINRPLLVKNQATFNSSTKNPYREKVATNKTNTNTLELAANLNISNISTKKDKTENLTKPSVEAANSLLSEKLNIASTIDVDNAPQPKEKSSRHALYIMNLNNRLRKQEIKLSNLESNLNQLTNQTIGYKELGLTLLLSILIFTSLGLVFANHSFIYKSLPIDNINQLFSNINSKLDTLQRPTNQNDTEHLGNITPIKKNQYQWPLERSPNHSQLSYNHFKSGINIPAKLGDPIVAIDKGTVIFSEGDFSDYGNLILVQHNDNVISVYGNNYSNYVKKGQQVKKGDLLAAVGETKGNVPRLYFEIRHKGKAQDPFLYY